MSLASEFIEALRRVEEEGELEPMARLFTEDAELSNPTMPRIERGPDGALRFWDMYRRSFQGIRSQFRRVIEGDEVAALEWTSLGTSPEGAEVVYEGVTVIEYAGGKITRFKAYFDGRALGAQLDRAA